MSADPDRLKSWRPGPTRDAALAFVDAAAAEVPVIDRVAMFDNDGTLWCERPNYVQLAFMVDELQRRSADDPSISDRPSFRAILDHDEAAIGDLGLQRVAMALLELEAGIDPVEFTARARAFMTSARHPTYGVTYLGTRYQPMLELIDLLRSYEFSVFLVTGGGTEFVRAISDEYYEVAPERVVGSLIGYEVVSDDDGRPRLLRTNEVFGGANEGPEKVVNIARGVGRRPIFAAGNTAGDADMLDYALGGDGPRLSVLINHDDAEREFAYSGEAATFTSGDILSGAADRGWTVVSMRDDWSTIFPN